jgi:hypothetical protein
MHKVLVKKMLKLVILHKFGAPGPWARRRIKKSEGLTLAFFSFCILDAFLDGFNA